MIGGSTSCLPCPFGSYSPQYAASSCVQCPAGKSTANVGARYTEQCSGAVVKRFTACNRSLDYDLNDTLNDLDINVTNSGSVLLQQLFQKVKCCNYEVDKTIHLNRETLTDPRLIWFLQQATGQEALNILNSTCVTKSRMSSSNSWNNLITGTMQCTGVTSIWGLPGSYEGDPSQAKLPVLTVVFIEVNRESLGPILHMSLLLLETFRSDTWLPFRYSGIPLFHGIPTDSWVHNVGFGGTGRVVDYILIQASTVNFNFFGCQKCKHISEKLPMISTSSFVFKQGFAFYANGSYVRTRIDGAHRLLGLERMMPKVLFMI
jgi:hypothetical protein